MRKLREETKIKRGYGTGIGHNYMPYLRVGEFGSDGWASNPWDWIERRSVHLFSLGESIAWHILRWDETTQYIQEQYPLDLEKTKDLAQRFEIRHPNNGKKRMTSDFLVTNKDQSHVVYSVKASAACLEDQRTREKLMLEKAYWHEQGIRFEMLFTDEMNRVYCDNIRLVVAFYDESNIVDDISIVKHLIAHRYLKVDMESAPLDFYELKNQYRKEVEIWKRLEQF